MDRQIIQIGAIPLDIDQLNQSKNVMIGLGMALQAILGTSTLVDGLACTPTSPASMQVHVAPGSIYTYGNVDNTAYGSVAADTAHQIVKQGINLGQLTFTLTAPVTTGFSVNYLVQAIYQDTDTGATVLPYYNSSNPSTAYNGPGNSGTSQNTVRQGQCVVSVIAGTAAATGSQTTPAPTTGYTGLFVITVANGATTVVSGNISQVAGAPFIANKLTALAPLASPALTGIPTVPTASPGTNTTQAASCAFVQSALTATRTILTGNMTFYVNGSSGSDSNNGLASGTPWQTRQHAWDTLLNTYDLDGHTVTVDLADGTYTDNFNPSGWAVGQRVAGQIIFNGDSATPSNVIINPSSSSCLPGTNCGYQIQNMLLENANYDCIDMSNNALIVVGVGIIFGATPNGCHMRTASPGASVIIGNSYTISGGAQAHYQAQCTGSQIDIAPGITITLTGTPAFSQYFANAIGGDIFFQSTPATFSGSATGIKYNATLGGAIQTVGSGASYLPGNSAGSSPSGYYV